MDTYGEVGEERRGEERSGEERRGEERRGEDCNYTAHVDVSVLQQ
jgi:hypothetical protein